MHSGRPGPVHDAIPYHAMCWLVSKLYIYIGSVPLSQVHIHIVYMRVGPAGLAVKPLDLHVVNVGSIPTGPTHGEVWLQPHSGDVLTSTPNVWKSPRSGLNLEGKLSDTQVDPR